MWVRDAAPEKAEAVPDDGLGTLSTTWWRAIRNSQRSTQPAPKVRSPSAQPTGLGGGAKNILSPNGARYPQVPQSLSRILVHVVFSTKNREPFLAVGCQCELHAYLAATLGKIGCPSLRVGGVEDHVHLLLGLSRTHAIADVVEALKTSSSKWIKTKGSEFAGFHWQSGYGAFSVSQSHADRVVAYICNQARHHQATTFQQEYRRLLERYHIAYDERYVWD